MKAFSKLKTFNIGFFLLLVLGSCIKENLDYEYSPASSLPPCYWDCDTTTYTSNLEIVWQHPLEVNSSPYRHSDIFLEGSNLYHNGKVSFYARNTQDGELLWEWSDYHPNAHKGNLTDCADAESILYLNARDETYAVDKYTGENQWIYSTDDFHANGQPAISTDGQKVFQIQTAYCQSFFDTIYLVSAGGHFENEAIQWDTLCTFSAKNGRYLTATHTAVWLSPENEVIILTPVNHWGNDGLGEYTDLVAYNYTRRDTQFVISDFMTEAQGKPSISLDGNYAVFNFSRNVVCFDLLNEQTVWTKDQSPSYNAQTVSVLNEMSIFSDENRTIAYETSTGHWIWKNIELTRAKFHGEYNGKLVGGGSKLIIVDKQTGQILLDEFSPNRQEHSNAYYGKLAIDAEKGLIYASDNHTIQCIKIPFD